MLPSSVLSNRFGKTDVLPGIVGPKGRHVGFLLRGQDELLRKEPGLYTMEGGPDPPGCGDWTVGREKAAPGP